MQDSSTSADGAGENVTSNAGEKPSHTAEPGADAKYASSTDDASDANKSQEAAAKEGEDDEEDEAAYPTGTGLLFLCIALVVSVFIVALSNTIIATAVPTITSAFNSYKDIGWYSAGELITATAFQLPFGRAYSLLSTKWLFFSSMGIYLVGSAICGAAPGSVALIVGRAIAGIGNAGVLGGAYIIIAKNVPLRKRAIYTGLIGAAFAVASVLGPIIGMFCGKNHILLNTDHIKRWSVHNERKLALVFLLSVAPPYSPLTPISALFYPLSTST
jgi:MFS family permease